MSAMAGQVPPAVAPGEEDDREQVGVIDMSEAARNLWLIKVYPRPQDSSCLQHAHPRPPHLPLRPSPAGI